MPRRKRIDDSDDEAGPSQGTQGTQGKTELSDAELNKLANALVHYMFVCDQKKSAIKQTDMKKQVLKENGGAFKQVIEIVRKKLSKIFDVELHAVEGRHGQYMLINKIEDKSEPSIFKWSEDEQIKQSLLFIILSAIFMNENLMNDDELWSMLKKFGIDPDMQHEDLGDVKKLIHNEYKQHLYLEIVKNTTTEPPSFEYKWGPRAHKELSKKDILEFVCELYPETTPESWIQQYKDAQNKDNST